MIESLRASGAKKFFLFILVFLLLTDLVILLDVPILRQVLGFLFFTIIPGLLILFILKLNKLGLTERIVLSVALSISFLMFFGLLINGVYPLLGYAAPLSTISLVVSFGVILLILTIIAYMRNQTAFLPNLADFHLDTKEKAFLLLPVFFPLLSILGVYLMNTTNSNVVLMVLLLLIPAYVIFIGVFNRRVPARTYPVIIFTCGLSLLLMWALRSNHIVMGADTDWEYYLYCLTVNNQHWQIYMGSALDCCLSISLLPAIYQSFLNLNPESLFRILYPLLFSISPLVVYLISKKYAGSFYAFIASLCFISFYNFFTTNARNNIALFFFALSMLVLLREDMSEFNRRLLFIVFSASCIVSHYSTTYIFFFMLLLTWVGMQIPRFIFRKRKAVVLSGNSLAGEVPTNLAPEEPSLRRNVDVSQATAPHAFPYRFKKRITTGTVILFFSLLFFWYSQITRIPFTTGVHFVYQTFVELHHSFILEASSTTVQIASGQVPYGGIPGKIEFIFSWTVIFFIAIGVLDITRKFVKDKVSSFNSSSDSDQPILLPEKLEPEYFILPLLAFAILSFSVIVPFISRQYDVTRIYFQMLVLLSVFFVFGGIAIVAVISKITAGIRAWMTTYSPKLNFGRGSKYMKWQPHWILLVVVIVYFMCTTSTMYQMFDIPRSIVLNSEGNQYDDLFIHEQESYAAKWLGESTEPKSVKIYTDYLGRFRVITQGMIPPLLSRVDNSLLCQQNTEIDGYIYLRYYNVVNGKIAKGHKNRPKIAEYQDKFAGKAKIYSNGGSEIWR